MTAGLQMRLWGRRGLATWLCLLRRWADKQLANSGATDNLAAGGTFPGFAARNKARQEALREVFASYYYLCPACGSQCCREPEIPYSGLDRVLFWGQKFSAPDSLPPAGASVRPKSGKSDYRSCFKWAHLQRKLKSFAQASRAPGGNGGKRFCPALARRGCRLSWGERPIVCVVCSCPKFLGNMSWKDFGRYLWLSGRYLAYLTRIMGRLQVDRAYLMLFADNLLYTGNAKR